MKDLIQREEKECQYKTSEVTWMAEMEVVLRTAFQEEINQKEVTLETVSSKISYHAELKAVSAVASMRPTEALASVKFWRISPIIFILHKRSSEPLRKDFMVKI